MKKFCILLLSICLTTSALVSQDQVILKNGDRLTGKVGALKEGKLTLATSYAASIEVAWDQVDSLTLERPLEVILGDGAKAQAAIRSPRPGVAAISDPSLGEVRLADIVSIGEPVVEDTRPGWRQHWNGSAGLGFNLTRGNSDTDNLAIHFRPERKTDKDRIRGDYNLIFSSQNGAEDNKIQDGSVRYDRFLSERLFYFGLAGFTTNQGQGLDLRSREGGGLGYRLIDSADTSLSVFGGISAVQEKFAGLPRLSQLQGLAGYELTTKLFGTAQFNTKTEYEPRFNQDIQLLRFKAGLGLPFLADFTVGLEFFDYFNSDPQNNSKRNDYGILSTLNWTF